MSFQIGSTLYTSTDAAALGHLYEMVWGKHTASSLAEAIKDVSDEQIVDDALDAMTEGMSVALTRRGPIDTDTGEPWFDTDDEWRALLISKVPTLRRELEGEL